MRGVAQARYGVEPLTRRSEDAYAKLRYAILEGQIEPGTRLTELTLCRNLSMSRVPIREALIRLEAEGLIERIPGGGFKAQTFSLEEIEEATELRAELECFAVRLACRRGFSDLKLVEMEHLADLIERAEQRREYRTSGRADLEFHQRLIALANSSRLNAAIRGAHLQLFT